MAPVALATVLKATYPLDFDLLGADQKSGKKAGTLKRSPWGSLALEGRLPSCLRRQVSFADSFPGLQLEDLKEFDKGDPPQMCNKHLTEQEYSRLKRAPSVPNLPLRMAHDMWQMSLPNVVITRQPQPLPSRQQAGTVFMACMKFDVLKRCMLGSIGVVNRAFEKAVFVRYTNDAWNTYHDVAAMYSWTRQGYHGPNLDFFSYAIFVEHALLVPGQKFEFAIGCHMESTMYWDNNGSENYAAEVTGMSS